ncbi:PRENYLCYSTEINE methylesterase [Coccomyxa subellipsoidea C-169]|uniref:protein-S-isoprenylcysteine alpha-carbonyl methylesterase n=1 Tax=Coccomyxa subellipsoidea (strain C-169) TaxID=574566 RepID=I0YJ04_COCSC|nr:PRENYLCYSTEINE methylesterase [Coccomyxa subellipsoidea C-169]EIE18373.1 PRENYLCYSTEINE methylesterase [Coccomyxa subellipsoidea C-169]|eukprot:XP_005642917.1 PRENYLCYSTEINE methylesterase [Coccomyxa subellipsoidea C-169]
MRAQRIFGAKLGELQDPLMEVDIMTRTPLQNAVVALEETFLVARLTIALYSYLGLGTQWTGKLLRLILYAMLLLPGFIQMAVYYFFSPRVTRSVVYGAAARNRLDIHRPPASQTVPEGGFPVVIYITGGAWTIGYKAWGSLLGRRLSKHGVIVYCLDYRNFPQGTVLDMLRDCNTGIRWVLHHAQQHGGDPSRMHLVGQSCGAQLATLALITQTEQDHQKAQLPGGFPAWSPRKVQSLIGVSGVYNCFDLADHFNQRGLYRRLFDRIMSVNGRAALKLFSPTYCVKVGIGVEWGASLPRVLLLHGTRDTCALYSNATQFRDALLEVELRSYEGETHTSPLIENPMRGGHDQLVGDILSVVGGPAKTGGPGEKGSPTQAPLCPAILINAAARVCPF